MTIRHLLPILFLLLGGCAHRQPAMIMDPMVVQGFSGPADATGRTNREILDEAVERRLRGDTEGARAWLSVILKQDPPPPEAPLAIYQLGLAYEADGDTEQAYDAYRFLTRNYKSATVTRDGWFRLALCLEDQGRHRRAVRTLSRIRLDDDLSLDDRLLLDLQRGISLVKAGRRGRGLATISSALQAADGTDMVPWMRAKAHVLRASVWLEEAERISLDVRPGRLERNLEERAMHMSAAEKEVAAAAWLGEPEWVLEGLLLLGQSYLSLHDDMLAARPPKELEGEALQVYMDLISQRAEVLKVKAWRHFEEGSALAVRTGFEGRVTERIRAARDELMESMGSLGAEDEE